MQIRIREAPRLLTLLVNTNNITGVQQMWLLRERERASESESERVRDTCWIFSIYTVTDDNLIFVDFFYICWLFLPRRFCHRRRWRPSWWRLGSRPQRSKRSSWITSTDHPWSLLTPVSRPSSSPRQITRSRYSLFNGDGPLIPFRFHLSQEKAQLPPSLVKRKRKATACRSLLITTFWRWWRKRLLTSSLLPSWTTGLGTFPRELCVSLRENSMLPAWLLLVDTWHCVYLYPQSLIFSLSCQRTNHNTWRQIIVTPAMFVENINEKNIILINDQYVYRILVLQNQKMIRIV